MDYEGNAVYYYVRDALGSVTALVDGRGKVAKRYFYSPYGKLREFPAWGERMMGMMGKRGRRGIANPLTYTGREYDKSTGLYYYRARYYNPGVGRFISVDPLMREFARSYAGSSALSGGSGGCGSCGGLGRGNIPSASSFSSLQIKWLHPYTYVNNNPVNYTDPEGLYNIYIEESARQYIDVQRLYSEISGEMRLYKFTKKLLPLKVYIAPKFPNKWPPPTCKLDIRIKYTVIAGVNWGGAHGRDWVAVNSMIFSYPNFPGDLVIGVINVALHEIGHVLFGFMDLPKWLALLKRPVMASGVSLEYWTVPRGYRP